MTSSSSVEELETAHKKALKALEGEKRAALKKAKALKGKKGKEALAATETEFANKFDSLNAKHQEDIAALAVASVKISNNNTGDGGDAIKPTEPPPSQTVDDPEEEARQRKLEKARKKREKQREKEAALEQQIADETANAGPSMRNVELGQLQSILSPLHLTVREVQADGHCLYRAVGAQTQQSFEKIHVQYG
ncbi:MAG: hypothetical protein SGARI_005181 [Bacillariaceae sp.]